MKIAVTSQNFKNVTPHAGKTRRFLVYEVGGDGEPVETGRLDLDKVMTIHEFRGGDAAHPLDQMDVSCKQFGHKRVALLFVQVSDSA